MVLLKTQSIAFCYAIDFAIFKMLKNLNFFVTSKTFFIERTAFRLFMSNFLNQILIKETPPQTSDYPFGYCTYFFQLD